MNTFDSEQYPASKYGIKDYRIEYWHGTGWGMIPTDDTKDRQYTARDNTKGKRVHNIRGKLFAQQIRIHRNVIDDTAVVNGIYTLQYTPKNNRETKQISGILSLVLAYTDDAWKIIRAD